MLSRVDHQLVVAFADSNLVLVAECIVIRLLSSGSPSMPTGLVVTVSPHLGEVDNSFFALAASKCS